MEALEERLDSMGLPHVTGQVLSSMIASGSIHDQVRFATHMLCTQLSQLLTA